MKFQEWLMPVDRQLLLDQRQPHKRHPLRRRQHLLSVVPVQKSDGMILVLAAAGENIKNAVGNKEYFL